MNIAIFASSFYPYVGGVEELVRQLCHEYRRRGHRVIVLTNRWPRSMPDFEIYQGIPVYRLAMRFPEGMLKAYVTAKLTASMIRRQTRRILEEQQIDLIHVQCVGPNGYYALHAARDLGIPLVVTTQGERTIDPTGLYQRSRAIHEVMRALIDEASYVTACSSATLAELRTWYERPLANRAHTVYNGIRADDFDSARPYRHHRPYVLGLGRLVPNKGFDVLIEAFARARPRGMDLLIAGDGPERGRLERLIADRTPPGRVRMLGQTNRTQTASLFRGCHCFVLPSRDEPQGIVVLEAMAAGRPVIATAVGGVPEMVIEGQTGLLVDGGDPESLADAISRLAADSDLVERLRQGGRRQAARFDWSVIAEQYLELYDRSLGRPAPQIVVNAEPERAQT